MSAPRIVVTTNGPGELMGWARPFLRALYERNPDANVSVVFVPCPYATGREPDTTAAMFPKANVIDSKAYGRFLLRKPVRGMERAPGALQYLGGDLFHATTIARRLGVRPMTYKFTKRSYQQSFVRFFALDERNAAELRRQGAPADRVRVVGNLVADGVLGSLGALPPAAGGGSSICIMPGSRPGEVRYGLQFFLAVATALARQRPGLPITFVFSPFTTDAALRTALGAPVEPRLFGVNGVLAGDGASIEAGGQRFAIDRSGDYTAMASARLIITIPGTKCIEAAVLGRPMLVAVPLNKPEVIAVNGLAGYLHLVPLVGRPLKSMVVRAAERRFRFVTQPNIDAGREIVPEMRGVLHPDDVAARASAMLADGAALDAMGAALSRIYAKDAGAARRMADEAIDVASEQASLQAAL